MSRIVTRSLSATAVALLAAAGFVAGAAPASAATYCGYAEAGVVSTNIPTIQCFPDLATSSPTISGKAMQGLTLQAVQGATWVGPVRKGAPVLSLEHYQWQRDGVVITDATSSTYTLTTADLGRKITVTMLTPVILNGVQYSWTSDATPAVSAYTAPAASPFRDVATGQQFYKEMSWLADRKISTGWQEGDGTWSYRALTAVNRDAMAAFLYRMAGSPAYTAPAVSPFSDVTTGQQFYKEMSWLAAENISAGWDEGNGTKTFRPVTPVGRDAMAAFLYRFAGKPTLPNTTSFVDVPPGTQFHEEISWLGSAEISTGWDEGNGTKTFRPTASVNRDAMAAFMYRFSLKYPTR